METTINQRIKSIFLQSGERSIRSYALSIGVAPTTLNECIKGSEPRFSLIKSILDGNPSISAEWLLRGTGDMELSSTAEKLEDEALSDNYILNVMANALDDLHKFLEIKENKINELEKELESYRKKQVG